MMQQLGPQGYGYPAQATPSASAVNIQIFEPKAYSSPAPSQVQNPIYNYPQQSMYAAPCQNQYQQYIPQQNTYTPAPQYQYAQNASNFGPNTQTVPQYQAQQNLAPQVAQTLTPAPEVTQVQQQAMPAPVLATPQVQETAPQQTTQFSQQAPEQAAQPQAAHGQATNANTPVIEKPYTSENRVDVNPALVKLVNAADPDTQKDAINEVRALINNSPDTKAATVNGLLSMAQSNDPKAQEAAITMFANLSQGNPDEQNAVLTEPVMNTLANIAAKDTSHLQGPTNAQLAAESKAASGAQLTPEEQALIKQLAPKTVADKNKAIAMFTLAMLQKNQRDEIDRYNAGLPEQNQLPQLKASDLIGYGAIENAARNGNDAEVQLAAIQALSYIARPEDKDTIAPVITAAMQSSKEPLVQQVAGDALKGMGSAVPQTPLNQEQPQPVDVSKMSKKEKRAYDKQQKKIAKEAAKAQKAALKAEKKAAKAEKKAA